MSEVVVSWLNSRWVQITLQAELAQQEVKLAKGEQDAKVHALERWEQNLKSREEQTMANLAQSQKWDVVLTFLPLPWT